MSEEKIQISRGRDGTPEDEALRDALTPPEEEPQSLPEEPVRVGEVEEDDAPEEKSEVTELSDEERQQFNALISVGKRVKKITVLDRPVTIASLMVDDVIRVGEKVKEYRDSQSFPQAYQAAMCAASIKSVDGQSWENTLEADPDPDVLFDQKWRKVLGFYPLVIQYIYNEVIALDAEFAELATKLGKL